LGLTCVVAIFSTLSSVRLHQQNFVNFRILWCVPGVDLVRLCVDEWIQSVETTKGNDVESMQPTINVESKSETPDSGKSSLDVSQAQVGFVDGRKPKFSDETAALLRSRITAAALLMSVILSLAFLGNLAIGQLSLWWLRFTILAVLVTSFALLRSSRRFSLASLRRFELLIFGVLAFQLMAMMVTELTRFASQEDVASLLAYRAKLVSAWIIIMLAYGMMLPNTWRRATGVLMVMAAIPYATIFCLTWFTPTLDALLAQDNSSVPLPLTFVAAAVGVFGAHVINSIRREAFKARQFGQYRLLNRLGAGGMGEVYQAEHTLLKRPCAIKLIKADSEADTLAINRFEKEVKATARLTHWNTVEIYDYGRTDDGAFYYVMELLPGLSLEEIVDAFGAFPPERVVHLLHQICGALSEAHSVGLIHRDIKPANIFASQRGGVNDVAKLLDFGLVKEDAESRDETSGRPGSFSGTPLYMAPEQATSYEKVDGRADIYSLGAVGFHLLTGQTPFVSKNVLELLAAHQTTQVPAPSQLNSAIPTDVEQIILKCMAKSPSDRFQDADELKDALACCSLANKWGLKEAADWWRNNDKQLPKILDEKATGGASDRSTATIEITQDM